jgi:hypothetical protein
VPAFCLNSAGSQHLSELPFISMIGASILSMLDRLRGARTAWHRIVSGSLKLFRDYRQTKGLKDFLEAIRVADVPEPSGAKEICLWMIIGSLIFIRKLIVLGFQLVLTVCFYLRLSEVNQSVTFRVTPW